jgi:hypothetical protein
MSRTATLLATCFFAFSLQAATGGPDQYGYIWKDSDEADGPVYEWFDITGSGTLINGLGDDNIVGPVILGENFPYYWYGVKKVFIGSNGYISFVTSGNIAAPFPNIPASGETDNYIAAFMTDLNFAGATNPAECWVDDNLERTIISYINVPYWDFSAPELWSGSNTFQYVLNKLDSTITINYMSTPCCSGSNGPMCGIEAINGDIGLQQSFGSYPPSGFSVRFYAPVVPLLDILDAAVEWVTDESNGARSIARNGTPFPLHTFIRNTGNQPITQFTVTSQILNSTNQVVAVDATNAGPLTPGQAADILFPNSFVASASWPMTPPCSTTTWTGPARRMMASASAGTAVMAAAARTSCPRSIRAM